MRPQKYLDLVIVKLRKLLTIYARKRILALKKERNEKWLQRITR
nr:MAG TPA: hypothetical protein [Caudoviricetes sp.]DAL62823.1 MAG TPA_asm: hypothetical protein [Caudoviricetes sp.]DAR20805.1 MAG TPA: hypothetical protein [Caudoviricetes sp.]